MDEALAKTGEWPNVALVPGTHIHAATGEHVEQPENTRIGHPRGACRPDGADCEHEPASVENRPQDGLECAELRKRLRIQANSFQKLERDNAKLRDTLARVRELVGDAE